MELFLQIKGISYQNGLPSILLEIPPDQAYTKGGILRMLWHVLGAQRGMPSIHVATRGPTLISFFLTESRHKPQHLHTVTEQNLQCICKEDRRFLYPPSSFWICTAPQGVSNTVQHRTASHRKPRALFSRKGPLAYVLLYPGVHTEDAGWITLPVPSANVILFKYWAPTGYTLFTPFVPQFQFFNLVIGQSLHIRREKYAMFC